MKYLLIILAIVAGCQSKQKAIPDPVFIKVHADDDSILVYDTGRLNFIEGGNIRLSESEVSCSPSREIALYQDAGYFVSTDSITGALTLYIDSNIVDPAPIRTNNRDTDIQTYLSLEELIDTTISIDSLFTLSGLSGDRWRSEGSFWNIESKNDTIPIKLLISEGPNVKVINGYGVRVLEYRSTMTFFDYPAALTYLDYRKNPLPKSITVWMIKENL